MKRTTTTTTPPAAPASQGRYYWTIQTEGWSAEACEKYGVLPPVIYPHSHLSAIRANTAKELVEKLRPMGWKPSDFDYTSAMLARVEVTKYGFNLVRFSNYAAAVEDDATRASKRVLKHLAEKPKNNRRAVLVMA